MLSKIKVYGRLARFLGQRTFEAEINSTVDAIRFLTANFPALQSHMIEQNYCIKVGDYEVNEKELDVPVGQQEIKIVPVAIGAGRGFKRFLVGAILVGTVIATGGFGTTAAFKGLGFTAGTGGLGASLAAAAGNIGIYLALSGASQMLTPTPEETKFDDPNSFNFNGLLNTINAGGAIPVVYGEVFTGSIMVSAGIDTEDFSGGT